MIWIVRLPRSARPQGQADRGVGLRDGHRQWRIVLVYSSVTRIGNDLLSGLDCPSTQTCFVIGLRETESGNFVKVTWVRFWKP